MLSLIARPVGAIKRNVLLPVLMHLDLVKPIGLSFRAVYRAMAGFTGWYLRQPGVRTIYLRRGMAKNEFMPFLSDIDLLIITDTAVDKQRVAARLKKLRKLLPMLESQSPVLTLADFQSWWQPDQFTANWTFLYRYLEARETWGALYSRDNDDPLAGARNLSRNELIAVIFPEIVFWHRIVITESTSYCLGHPGTHEYVQRKRFCWILMKATTELDNFLGALRGKRRLLYTRRQANEAAIREAADERWISLFASNLAIIDNHFDPAQSDRYVCTAMSFLSESYKGFHALMSGMLAEDTGFPSWARAKLRRGEGHGQPEWHPVNLESVPSKVLAHDENVSALYVAPHLRANRQYKVVIIVAMRVLAPGTLKAVRTGVEAIAEQLVADGLERGCIEVDLVDDHGLRCFGIARRVGQKKVLKSPEGDGSVPATLYDRIFFSEALPSASRFPKEAFEPVECGNP